MWIISVTSRDCAIHLIRDLGGCGSQGERFSCQTTKYKQNNDALGHYKHKAKTFPRSILPEAFWECNDLKKMLEFFK